MTDSYQKILDDLRHHATEAGEYNSAMDFIHFAERLEALRAQPVAWMNSYQYNDFLNGHQQFHANPHKYEQYDIPLIRAD